MFQENRDKSGDLGHLEGSLGHWWEFHLKEKDRKEAHITCLAL